MPTSTILVVTDAGAAGRVLLGRSELDVRWALTVDEALAVAEALQPRACLVRERTAVELLEAFQRLEQAPPVIVLLGPDGWDRRHMYSGLGAAALAAETAIERIQEAIAELTETAFRGSPRVPFATVIDAEVGGEPMFLETVDLSVSGVSVRGLLDAAPGARAELSFVMCEPPVTVGAVVARTFEQDGETLAGMRFSALDDEQQRAISALVEEQARIQNVQLESVGFTGDLCGELTRDLGDTIGAGAEADRVYFNMLRESLCMPAVMMPTWLKRVQVTLTPIERAALENEDEVSPWVTASVLFKIHLKRVRAESPVDHRIELELPRVFEHCTMLAREAAGSSREVLVQICGIRASLLREAYEPRRLPLPPPAVKPVPIARVAVKKKKVRTRGASNDQAGSPAAESRRAR